MSENKIDNDNEKIDSSSEELLNKESKSIDKNTDDALSIIKNEKSNQENNDKNLEDDINLFSAGEDFYDDEKSKEDDVFDDDGDDLTQNSETTVEPEEITEAQQKKYEKIGEVKEKISKILQAKNIEIVDENIGDEYETDESDSQKQQQQDYDSLKALFGDDEKNKKKELTLTIDDFDYTYIGQYVDEFDLMHVKNIKHIKLRKKHSKNFKKLVIAASVILFASIAGLVTFLLLRTKPVVMQSVVLNQTKNSYYINQDFEYTGLYFNVTYSDGTVKHVPLDASYLTDIVGNYEKQPDGKIKFTGGAQADLTFSYNGFNVFYQVEIKQKTLNEISAIYSDGLLKLNAGSYITSDYLELICDYGSYGKESLPLSSAVSIKVDGVELRFYSSNSGFLVENNINEYSEIEISYLGKTHIIKK